MSEHLVKIALVVVMTHGYRTLGRKVGPRWGGLATGLPCTSAVALVGSGCDRGIEYAVAMAETSLLGLVGAATLPLVYARGIGAGWSVPWVVAAAIGSYVAATSVAGLLYPPGGGGCLAISSLAVLTAASLARRIVVPEEEDESRPVSSATVRTWAIRTIIPVACLLVALALGEAVGPGSAGVMSTFPGVTLTILLLTHMEGGPGPATRLAQAFPPGNLGMVAFLATFRSLGPGLGLGWGTAIGYLAAVTMLAIVARFGSREVAQDSESRHQPRPHGLTRPGWPRDCRRFSPLVESIAA